MIRRLIRTLNAAVQPRPLGRHNARRTDVGRVERAVAEVLSPPRAAMTLQRRMEILTVPGRCPESRTGSHALWAGSCLYCGREVPGCLS